MAIIRPFRAWRYNSNLKNSIEELTSPLFDVASEQQIEALRQNPLNSIHLTLPSEPHSAKRAKETLGQWKKNKTLVQERAPAFYVYYQYFSLNTHSKVHCRKGIIAMVRFPDKHTASKDQILVHEATIKAAVENRKVLLRETMLCTSPTHGLYEDPSHGLDAIMEKSMISPLYDVTDYQGVRDVISEIHDKEEIKKIISLISEKKIALADGHHRYQAGLDLRKEQAGSSEASNYHLMYLTNSHADDFRILATHRLVHTMAISEVEFISAASKYFVITEIDKATDTIDLIVGKKWTFGIIFKDKAYQLSLKPEMSAQFNNKLHAAVRSLDVVIAHTFIIEKILQLPRPAKLTATEISFESSYSECLAKIEMNKADMAIIINEISPAEVFNVGEKGAIMPQKTTFFYPKIVGGYLFGTIKDDEFDSTLYTGF